jgi:hypothetical protein
LRLAANLSPKNRPQPSDKSVIPHRKMRKLFFKYPKRHGKPSHSSMVGVHQPSAVIVAPRNYLSKLKPQIMRLYFMELTAERF